MNKPGRWLVCRARPTSKVSSMALRGFRAHSPAREIREMGYEFSWKQCCTKTKHLTHKYRKASNVALGTQALCYNRCRNQAHSTFFLLLTTFFSVFQAHGHALVHEIYAASFLLSSSLDCMSLA